LQLKSLKSVCPSVILEFIIKLSPPPGYDGSGVC